MNDTTLERPVRWGLGDAAAGYAVAIIASGLLGSLWLAAADRTALGLGGLALAQVGLWTGFLGAPLYSARVKGSGSLAADFGLAFRRFDAPIGLLAGVASQLVLVPLVYLPLRPFVDTGGLGRPAQELADSATGLGFVALAVVVVAGAPVVEELFFRGLLLSALERRVGRAWALAASSAVFGVTHFQLLQLPGLAAFGAVLASLTLRSGRLGPAVWAHVGFNATTMASLAFLA